MAQLCEKFLVREYERAYEIKTTQKSREAVVLRVDDFMLTVKGQALAREYMSYYESLFDIVSVAERGGIDVRVKPKVDQVDVVEECAKSCLLVAMGKTYRTLKRAKHVYQNNERGIKCTIYKVHYALDASVVFRKHHKELVLSRNGSLVRRVIQYQPVGYYGWTEYASKNDDVKVSMNPRYATLYLSSPLVEGGSVELKPGGLCDIVQ